jgi:hypothetical protein
VYWRLAVVAAVLGLGPVGASLVPDETVCLDCGPGPGISRYPRPEGHRSAAAWSPLPAPEELPVPRPRLRR